MSRGLSRQQVRLLQDLGPWKLSRAISDLVNPKDFSNPEEVRNARRVMRRALVSLERRGLVKLSKTRPARQRSTGYSAHLQTEIIITDKGLALAASFHSTAAVI